MPYPNTHTCEIKSSGLFQKDSIRSMGRSSNGKPFLLKIGRLKGETTTTTQALWYPKKSWTAVQARAHCKEHRGISFEPATKE